MLLAKPVKKVFAKVFPSQLVDLTEQVANIPIRHFDFKFSPDELDVKFYAKGMGDCLFCSTFNFFDLWRRIGD